MEEEKRTIQGYEIKNAIHIGGREIIMAEDNSKNEPYMVCNCSWDNPFNMLIYDQAVVSEDYLEIMSIFIKRIDNEVQKIAEQRIERGVSHIPLTANDCIENSNQANYSVQLIVIKPEIMAPSARTADNQLLLALSGNGCNPHARGTAVFCRNLFTGKETRWERHDIAGIIRPDRIPEWAQNKLAALNHLANTEMSLEQNYNQIDGIINNTAAIKADLTDGQTLEEIRELAPETLTKNEKPSVLRQLKEGKRVAEKQPHNNMKKSSVVEL